MDGDKQQDKEVAKLRRERVKLVDQIRQSQETIKRSRALLQRIDEQLAKSVLKP